ncbi:carboxypeptidase-like regulatory domain-containing protein [Beggiatoa leptomitoformis]|uniref:Carboxypeptidase regulatory-like domain-containing protein n=1 Tax=Beggiatoa leptomitoformis TaxID=288004 RepID=A0A2N9YEB4_9GAMM|nr:carboxypeptidase regulatory-like domain-containing protein [Beggiatoa leptomitoformis]ALG68815.1 hypothetical protein AL038_15305 [Beggiatoa leptomitoformis]AUI68822.1 hypothetical protein BLE401_08950 [Beggiatoa leptomitoformis]
MRKKLYDLLEQSFEIPEINEIIFSMGIQLDRTFNNRTELIIALITYCEHREMLKLLEQEIFERRPNLKGNSMDKKEPVQPVKPQKSETTRDEKLANIYIKIFAISAFVAIVIYLILPSSTLIEGTINGLKINTTGGVAGFLLCFFALVFFYQKHAIQEKSAITGNVFDEENSPITGATVFVDGIDRKKTTDETGWFTLEVEQRAEWTVRASKESYLSASTTIKTTDIPVTLVLKNRH